MFFAFAIFGMVPVGAVALVPLANPKINPHDLFVAACVVTAIALFFLGAYKANFNDKRCIRYSIQPTVRETTARPRGPHVGRRAVLSREVHVTTRPRVTRGAQVPSLRYRGIAPRRSVRDRRLRRRARRQRLRHRRALRGSVIRHVDEWSAETCHVAVGRGSGHTAQRPSFNVPIATIIHW